MRKLPVLTERSISRVKAERLGMAATFDAKLPIVACKSGCSACCSYPVYISVMEGILLYRHLTAKGQWTPSLRKKLEKHAEQTFDVAPTVWLTLDLPCALLEKNKCLGYDARPFACRSLYAITDAKSCHPYRMQDAIFVEREQVLSAFRDTEAKILARHKMALLGMPISKAILLAEKIIRGDADLEHFLTIMAESLGAT
jgi:hypothetical protein